MIRFNLYAGCIKTVSIIQDLIQENTLKSIVGIAFSQNTLNIELFCGRDIQLFCQTEQ